MKIHSKNLESTICSSHLIFRLFKKENVAHNTTTCVVGQVTQNQAYARNVLKAYFRTLIKLITNMRSGSAESYYRTSQLVFKDLTWPDADSVVMHCMTYVKPTDRPTNRLTRWKKRDLFIGSLHIWLEVVFFSKSKLFTPINVTYNSSALFTACCRKTEERGGAAAGDKSLLCEKWNRAGSEARVEEQWPPTSLAVERTGCATQITAEMRKQLIYLPYAADIPVADAKPLNTTLLLGLVSRTGQT